MNKSNFNRLLHLSNLVKCNTSDLNDLLQQKKDENHGWIMKIFKKISYNKYKDCKLLTLKIDEDGKVVKMPDDFLKCLGYTRREIEAMPFHNLYSPEKRLFYKKLLAFVMESDIDLGYFIREKIAKEGDPVIFAARLEVKKGTDRIVVDHKLFPIPIAKEAA